MKKEEILLMTNKFIIYYDKEIKRYDFPSEILDDSNKFKFDILCIQLNKIIKNLKNRKVYLFYVDPDFKTYKPRTYEEYESILNTNSNEDLEKLLYQKVDTEKYEGRVFAFNDTVNILLRDRYNSDVLARAVNEISTKIFLCDLFEPLNNYAKKNNYTGCFMFFFQDLYFYYIFKSGSYDFFDFKERTIGLNESETSNNIESNVVMSDLGTLISCVGHIKDHLNTSEKADFILFSKLAQNETLEEYFKTLSFKTYNAVTDINAFLLDEFSSKPIVKFNIEDNERRKFSLKPYMLVVFLSIIIFGLSLYKYLYTKNENSNLKNSFIQLDDNYKELNKASESLKIENEKKKNIIKELDQIKAQFSFSNLKLLDKVYEDLKDYGEITNIEIKDDNLIVSIVTGDEINFKNYDVVKKFTKDNKFHYTLRYKDD